MGRTVTTVDTAPVWYVPDIDNNRKDPEPFKVLLSPLTAGDKARADHAALSQAVRGSNGDGDTDAISYAAKDMLEGILAKRIVEVSGYMAIDEKTGAATMPKTGAELVDAVKNAEPGEMEVLDDIWAALQKTSTLKAGVLGNSEGRPDSLEPPTSGASKPESETASTTSAASAGAATSTLPKTPMVHESSETPGAARAT